MGANLIRHLIGVKKLDSDQMSSYLSVVQMKNPRFGGSNSRVCVMSLASAFTFERAMDRFAPAVLLVLGLASAAAMAFVGS
jgi:hypothetical protein